MIPSDQTPPGVDWIQRQMADLDRQLQERLAGLAAQQLARPWLPVTWALSTSTAWPSTTSASFVSLLESAIPRQQPRIVVRVRHTTDVSLTTGELRVMCAGTQIGATVPVTFTPGTTDIGPLALPTGAYSAVIGLTVDARRTAGSGAVRVMVTGAWTQK